MPHEENKNKKRLSHTYCATETYLINKRHGSRMLEQTIWLWNHTSHTKVYFNEFVANVLRDNIGMIIFDRHGGC